MDDSSDDGGAVPAHATPGRRHSWASVHTPIDWSSAASLRAELARVDARRATLLNALAALEDGVEALNNSSSDEESCCDLTQATVGGGDRTPPPPDSDEDLVDLTESRAVWKSKFYGTFVLNHRVVLHAIDATPARWRGDAGSSPLDRARTAESSPRNDLVKSRRVHPTHWLISTQVPGPGARRADAGARRGQLLVG